MNPTDPHPTDPHPTDPHPTNPHFTDAPVVLRRPGALVAAIPAVLGFVPEHSLVVVTVDDGHLGAVLRVDLDAVREDAHHTGAAGLGTLADLVVVSAPEAAFAVIVDEAAGPCAVCADLHAELAAQLRRELEARGTTLWDTVVVDAIVADERWWCADGCGTGGAIDDPASSPLAAAAVFDGRRLYAHRADLEAVVAPDMRRREALAPLLEAAGDGHRRGGRDVRARQDVAAAIAAARSLAAGRAPTDRRLVRLGGALRNVMVRDTLYALAVGSVAAAAEALWTTLARELPPPWRVEPLVLLAFSAYARGDGPLAGVALDAALREAPEHRMATMLDQALQAGMRPDRIRELAWTGYRLADRLGVVLPTPCDPVARC